MPRARLVGRQNHVVGVDAIAGGQHIAQARAPLRAFPPVEHRAQTLAADGKRVFLQQSQSAQVQHHLGHAARQKDAHGRVVARAIRQHIDQAGHAAVDRYPVFDAGAL